MLSIEYVSYQVVDMSQMQGCRLMYLLVYHHASIQSGIYQQLCLRTIHKGVVPWGILDG